MAMIGFSKSASFMPVARHSERAPAMFRPWVDVRLRYPWRLLLMPLTLPEAGTIVQPRGREFPPDPAPLVAARRLGVNQRRHVVRRSGDLLPFRRPLVPDDPVDRLGAPGLDGALDGVDHPHVGEALFAGGLRLAV